MEMGRTAHDIYQLAGVDPRERGFNRPVDLLPDGRQYRANLRYEAARIAADPAGTQEAALERLIALLHERGYRQLKAQMSFRDGIYLGSSKPWIEYPDPSPPPQRLFAALRAWFQRDTRAT